MTALLRAIDGGNFDFYCPGCNHRHPVAVGTPFHNGARWTFNESMERPTFSPSLHCKSGHYADGTAPQDCWLCKRGSKACGVCHSFIRDGQIQFLSDCTHDLAGQTVPIPPPPGEAA